MNYHLQMTFIPHGNEQGTFFLWLTNEKGRPIVYEDEWLEKLLAMSGWHSYFTPDSYTRKQYLIEHADVPIRTTGLSVSMSSLYHLLQEDIFAYQGMAYFQFGESFVFWRKVARGLDILIHRGQYYPSLYMLEKEGQHYAFAQWMLSRRLLLKADLFNEWLRSLPALVLSAVELAPLPIRQWFNVLLDTWVDQIIRNALEPAYYPLLQDWPDSDLFERLLPQWFYYLTVQENAPFIVTHDKDTVTQARNLIEHIEQWHEPLVDDLETDPKQVLITFKKTYMESYIRPLVLLVCLEPTDPDNPFGEWSKWDVSLKAEGIKAEEKTPSIFEAETVWYNHPASSAWLEDMIDELANLDDRFFPLVQQKYRGDFSMQTSVDVITEFYQEHAPSLEQIGIQFQFPSWLDWKNWTEENVDIHLETSSPNEEATFSLSSIIEFDWKISIGPVSLSTSEFMKLVQDRQRFLQHQGEWVELPLDKMMAAYQEMSEINKQVGQKGRMSDLVQLSLAEKRRRRKHLHLDIHAQAENYLKKLVQKPKRNLPVPTSFHGELRPYQQEGFTWLHSLREKGVGGCLADDMGLGKTIQTIVYLLTQSERDPGRRASGESMDSDPKTDTGYGNAPQPALIVCPTSLIGNWRRELHRFSPELRVYAHHGAKRYDQGQFEENKANIDIIITSYTLAVRDGDWLVQQEWSSLILDEAQAIKNPSTKQSQNIRRFQARHRLALTGTPMENRLEELWSIMHFLNPGYLGSLKGFRQQFITPIEKHQDDHKAKLLQRLIQPFLLRREKTDTSIIQDLPDKVEKKEFCYLTREQATLYQSVVDELMRKMSFSTGIERKGLILATLTKLKQVCDHPQLVLKKHGQPADSGKLTRFFELIDPLMGQDQSALVFTQYVGMGELLQASIQDKYRDCPVFFLHGGLSSTKREEMIHQFRENHGQKAIFILSLKAGGVGLNLTEANHVIHYDRWWNPAVEDQATDRTYRIGQQKNVHVYKLISEGTLEEKIDQLIDKKRNLTAQILGQDDGWVTELNDDEVYELIRLREQVFA